MPIQYAPYAVYQNGYFKINWQIFYADAEATQKLKKSTPFQYLGV